LSAIIDIIILGLEFYPGGGGVKIFLVVAFCYRNSGLMGHFLEVSTLTISFINVFRMPWQGDSNNMIDR